MTPAFIGGGEEGAEAIEGHGIAGEARAEGQNIGVIVLAGEPGFGDIARLGAANGGVAVGGEGHADAGAADQEAEAGGTSLNALADRVGEIRVIAAGGGVGAAIDHGPAGITRGLGQLVLEEIAGVIGADRQGAIHVHCVALARAGRWVKLFGWEAVSRGARMRL